MKNKKIKSKKIAVAKQMSDERIMNSITKIAIQKNKIFSSQFFLLCLRADFGNEINFRNFFSLNNFVIIMIIGMGMNRRNIFLLECPIYT